MARIQKILVLMIVLHAGCAFVSLTYSYNQGYTQTYGMSGWLAVTPVSDFYDLEDTGSTAVDVSLSNVPGFFTLVFNIGGTINGLTWFSYGFLNEITKDNFFFFIVLGLRLLSVLVSLGVAFALIQMALQSNLLTSKIGLALLGAGGLLSLADIFRSVG